MKAYGVSSDESESDRSLVCLIDGSDLAGSHQCFGFVKRNQLIAAAPRQRSLGRLVGRLTRRNSEQHPGDGQNSQQSFHAV